VFHRSFQKNFGIHNFIVVTGPRGKPAVLMASKIRNGVAVIVEYIRKKVGLLKNIGNTGKVLVKRPDLRPPYTLIIVMRSRVIYDPRISSTFRVVCRTVN